MENLNYGRICFTLTRKPAAVSSGLVFVLDTAKDSFDVILQVGAGTGLLYLVRWYWWRVNAWCEVVAMISSFLVSIVFLILEKEAIYSTSTASRLLMTIAITTICWVLAAYFAPQTDKETLIEFYKKVHPSGPGWDKIRHEAGISKDQIPESDNIPLALAGWVAGCTMIWSSLFTVGNFLYGRTKYGILLLIVFIFSGSILLMIVNKLWSGKYKVEPELEPEFSETA